jgi:hypothetical protein
MGPSKPWGVAFRKAAPVLAGIVVGMGIALFVVAPRVGASQTKSPLARTNEGSSRAPIAEPASTDSAVDRRFAALEKRMEELSRVKADSPATPPAADFETDREIRKQRALSDHAELLARHRSETRDPAWASNHERQVRAALGELSETMKHSFSLQSVDCRTASCVARLTWPSETAARLDAASFMGGSAAVRCARTMTLAPADGPGPYTASLYLDCAEYRWGLLAGHPG